MFIPAVIAIACLSLVFFPPGVTYYYQVPMGIIGNVYANSMLLRINSRRQIYSKKEPLTMVTVSKARFGAAPTNGECTTIEAHNGDPSVVTGETATRSFDV